MKAKLLFSLLTALVLTACGEQEKEMVAADAEMTVTADRGEYLVTTIGCTDCHTPKKMTPEGPVPDEALFLSGHPQDEELLPYDPNAVQGYALFNMGLTAAHGPWGTSFAANLTPDETGIGSWTEEQFLRAMKEGQWRGLEGTRKILPPMPWENYRHLTDDDLKSIFAYLRTIKPVDNVVPNAIPPAAM